MPLAFSALTMAALDAAAFVARVASVECGLLTQVQCGQRMRRSSILSPRAGSHFEVRYPFGRQYRPTYQLKSRSSFSICENGTTPPMDCGSISSRVRSRGNYARASGRYPLPRTAEKRRQHPLRRYEFPLTSPSPFFSRAWQRHTPPARVLRDTHKGHRARVRACHAQGVEFMRRTRSMSGDTHAILRPMYRVNVSNLRHSARFPFVSDCGTCSASFEADKDSQPYFFNVNFLARKQMARSVSEVLLV